MQNAKCQRFEGLQNFSSRMPDGCKNSLLCGWNKSVSYSFKFRADSIKGKKAFLPVTQIVQNKSGVTGDSWEKSFQVQAIWVGWGVYHAIVRSCVLYISLDIVGSNPPKGCIE